MDYEEMPATSKEILQFTQDITSGEFVAAIKKKANTADLDELYLVADEEESHDAPEQPISPPASKQPQSQSKNKRRKRRRAQQRSQLLFQRVPKIPAVFDHFFHVRRDSRAKVSADDCVKECMDTLLPYLYWKREDWLEQCLSCDDVKEVVCMTGMYYTNTYKKVEGCYTVHVYSDMQQSSDSQTLVYDILLFVVCKRVNKQCYCIKNFFFMKNEH